MLLLGSALAVISSTAIAQSPKRHDIRVTDTSIKIGQTMPYSGPGSVLSVEGRVEKPSKKVPHLLVMSSSA